MKQALISMHCMLLRQVLVSQLSFKTKENKHYMDNEFMAFFIKKVTQMASSTHRSLTVLRIDSSNKLLILV